VGGRGQERLMGWGFGYGRGVFETFARASGGAGGDPRLFSPALIKIIVQDRFRLSGIEAGSLVEVVRDGFLGGLVVCPTVGPDGELGLRGSPGGMKKRGRSGFTDMGQDLCDGLGVGEEGDERERRLAGWTNQGEDFVDPSQEGGPSGRPGRGGVGWLGWCRLCLVRRSRGGCWERKTWTGKLSGEGVVLPSPGGDQRPQRSIGSENTVVSVAVNSGWRKDCGQAVQELEGGETERGAAGGIGLGEDVEDLVGAVAEQVEPFEGEGRPSTIPDEPLKAVAVGGLDADAGVQAEPATVIPGQHVLGLVGFQEAVAAKMPQDPGTDRVLEGLQEFVGEGCGLVEAEAGFWSGGTMIRVSLELLEEPIDHAQVEMIVRVQRRAEAVEEADRAHSCGSWSRGTGLPQGGLEGAEEDVKHGAAGPGPVVEVRPQTLGNGENPLADWHVGNDVVHQVGRCSSHALGTAGGTGPSALAGKGHQEVVAAARASGPGEAVSQNAASEIASELLFHVIRYAVAHGIGLIGQGEVGLQVFPDNPVQGGGFGTAPTIGLGMGVSRCPGW
jgi:hypothetical protein